MNLTNFKKHQVILIICFLVFAVSLVYALYFDIEPVVDARAYDTIAVNILETGEYRISLESLLAEDHAIHYQGPVYPFFLTAIYGAFGHHIEMVWIVQAFLRALTAFLLFLICKRAFGKSGRLAGLFAAGFFGFYPDLIEMSAMLMSETFYIFLSVLIVYAFLLFYERASFNNTALLALVFGATILTRSTIGIFLPVFLFVFYKKRAYKQLLLFFVLLGLVMAPWAVRNFLVYQKFIPTMANTGFNPWVGNHEGGDGEGGNMPELRQALHEMGPIKANQYALEQFKSFLKDHPFRYLVLSASRTMKYFSFIRPIGFWFYQRGWSQFIFVLSSALASVFLFTFGFAGIFAGLRKKLRDRQFVFLVLFALLTCLSIIPFLIETRYRMPIYPFMAIFSGFFISRFLHEKREYLKYLIGAFVILFLNTSINIALEYNKIIEKIGQIFYGS